MSTSQKVELTSSVETRDDVLIQAMHNTLNENEIPQIQTNILSLITRCIFTNVNQQMLEPAENSKPKTVITIIPILGYPIGVKYEYGAAYLSVNDLCDAFKIEYENYSNWKKHNASILKTLLTKDEQLNKQDWINSKLLIRLLIEVPSTLSSVLSDYLYKFLLVSSFDQDTTLTGEISRFNSIIKNLQLIKPGQDAWKKTTVKTAPKQVIDSKHLVYYIPTDDYINYYESQQSKNTSKSVKKPFAHFDLVSIIKPQEKIISRAKKSAEAQPEVKITLYDIQEVKLPKNTSQHMIFDWFKLNGYELKPRIKEVTNKDGSTTEKEIKPKISDFVIDEKDINKILNQEALTEFINSEIDKKSQTTTKQKKPTTVTQDLPRTTKTIVEKNEEDLPDLPEVKDYNIDELEDL